MTALNTDRMASEPKAPRDLRYKTLMAASIALPVLLTFIPPLLPALLGISFDLANPYRVLHAFVVFTSGVVPCLLAARRLDETARAAQYTAWMWGGASGFFIAISVTMAALFSPAIGDAFHSFLSPVEGWRKSMTAFALGSLFTGVVMFATALIVWLVWWAKRR